MNESTFTLTLPVKTSNFKRVCRVLRACSQTFTLSEISNSIQEAMTPILIVWGDNHDMKLVERKCVDRACDITAFHFDVMCHAMFQHVTAC